MSNKYSDGISNPHSNRKRGMDTIFYRISETPPTIRELIDSLPTDLFPKRYIKRLLDDLDRYKTQLLTAAQTFNPPLDKEDAETLFVYTYELYEPTLTKVDDIDAPTLAKVLKKMKVPADCVKQLLNSAIDGACIMDQHSPATEFTDEKIRARFPNEGEALAVIRARDELRGLREVCLGDYDCGKHAKNQIYGCMNRTMRETNEAALAKGLKIWGKWIHRIELTMKKIPALTERKEVFRGVNIEFDYVKYAPGEDFLWPAFSSTSASKQVGKEFARGGTGRGTLFIANVLSGRNISMFSKFPEEEEFLLPPNTHFIVRQGMTRTMMEMAECEQIIVLEETEKLGGAIFEKLKFEPTAYDFWNRSFGSDESVTWSKFEDAHLKLPEDNDKMKEWLSLRMQQYQSPQHAAAYKRFALEFCDQNSSLIQALKSAVVTVSSFKDFLCKWKWMDMRVVLKMNLQSKYYRGDLGKVVGVDETSDGGLELTVHIQGKEDLVVDANCVEREVPPDNTIMISTDPKESFESAELLTRYGYHPGETLMFTRGTQFKGKLGTVLGVLADNTMVVSIEGKREPLYANKYYITNLRGTLRHSMTSQASTESSSPSTHPSADPSDLLSTAEALWKAHGPIRVKAVSEGGPCASTTMPYPKHARRLLRRIQTELLLEPVVDGNTVILTDARTMSNKITVRPDGVVFLRNDDDVADGSANQLWLPTVGGLFNSVADSSEPDFYLGFRLHTYDFPNETNHHFQGAYACLIEKNEVDANNKYSGSLRRSPISLETNSFFLYCNEKTTSNKHTQGTVGVLGLVSNWLGDPILMIARVPVKTDSATLELKVAQGCCNSAKTVDFVGREFALAFRPLYFQNLTKTSSYLSKATKSVIAVLKVPVLDQCFQKKKYFTISSDKRPMGTRQGRGGKPTPGKKTFPRGSYGPGSFVGPGRGSFISQDPPAVSPVMNQPGKGQNNTHLETSLLADNYSGTIAPSGSVGTPSRYPEPIQTQNDAEEARGGIDINNGSLVHISTVKQSQLIRMMLVDHITWSVDYSKNRFPTQAVLRCNASMPCDVDVKIEYMQPSQSSGSSSGVFCRETSQVFSQIGATVGNIFQCSKGLTTSTVCRLLGGRMLTDHFTLTGRVVNVSLHTQDKKRSDIPIHVDHCPRMPLSRMSIDGNLPMYLQDIKIDRSTDLVRLVPYSPWEIWFSYTAFFLKTWIFGWFSTRLHILLQLLSVLGYAFTIVGAVKANFLDFIIVWTVIFTLIFWPSAAAISFILNSRKELHEDLVANAQSGKVRDGLAILLSCFPVLPIVTLFGFSFRIVECYKNADIVDRNTPSFRFAVGCMVLSILCSMIGLICAHFMFFIVNRISYCNVKRFIATTANNPEVLINTDAYLLRYMSLVHRVDVTQGKYQNIMRCLRITNLTLLFVFFTVMLVLLGRGYTFVDIYNHYSFQMCYPFIVYVLTSEFSLAYILRQWIVLPEELCGIISNHLEYVSRIPGFSAAQYLELLEFIRRGQPIQWPVFTFIKVCRASQYILGLLLLFIVCAPLIFANQLTPTKDLSPACMYQFAGPSIPCKALPAPDPSNNTWVDLFPKNHITFQGRAISSTTKCSTNTTLKNCTYSSTNIPVSCAGLGTRQGGDGVYSVFVNPSEPGYNVFYNLLTNLAGLTSTDVHVPFKCDEYVVTKGQCVAFRVDNSCA